VDADVAALLEKARASNAAARSLTEGGHHGFACSRAYYSMFYAAEALLLAGGQAFSSHGAVIAAFGKQYAKTELLPRRYHQYLTEAFRVRQVADYDFYDQSSPEEALTAIERAEEFVEIIWRYLAGSR
jgi:uncharacterized protein (UPF0332 family)